MNRGTMAKSVGRGARVNHRFGHRPAQRPHDHRAPLRFAGPATDLRSGKATATSHPPAGFFSSNAPCRATLADGSQAIPPISPLHRVRLMNDDF
jgi:hypothetical protein